MFKSELIVTTLQASSSASFDDIPKKAKFIGSDKFGGAILLNDDKTVVSLESINVSIDQSRGNDEAS